jgi:hypothetical protein
MAGLDLNYDRYTGDTFPALSGSSVTNACFSYIFNPAEFKQSPMYSAAYSKKMDAITKYLQKKLSTQDQALELFFDFFQEYVQPVFEKHDPDQPVTMDSDTDPAEEATDL